MDALRVPGVPSGIRHQAEPGSLPMSLQSSCATTPWLEEADVKLALQRQPVTGPAAHRPGEALIPVPVDEGEAVEEAFEHVQRELEEKREEWKFFDEEEEVNFYVKIRGGKWTAANRGTVADCVMCKARSHSVVFCKTFQLPSQKSFSFARYGGEGPATDRAREWARLLSYYMDKWTTSGGHLTFRDPHSWGYQLSENFLNFATDLEVDHPAFDQVMILRGTHPQPR